jgi:hypothetical protein
MAVAISFLPTPTLRSPFDWAYNLPQLRPRPSVNHTRGIVTSNIKQINGPCQLPHLSSYIKKFLHPAATATADSMNTFLVCQHLGGMCSKYAKISGLCLEHIREKFEAPTFVTPKAVTMTTASYKNKRGCLCSHEECKKAAKSKGFCTDHGGRHLCKMEDCQKCAHRGGFCIAHGGGRRCNVDGCTKSAQTGGTCYSHGGRKQVNRHYCKRPGCHRCAHKGGFCITHGGGRRCDVAGCTRSAQVGGSCYSHGGGKRCQVDGCNHAGRIRGFCIKHKKEMDV